LRWAGDGQLLDEVLLGLDLNDLVRHHFRPYSTDKSE
jgi:hypothetical protein